MYSHLPQTVCQFSTIPGEGQVQVFLTSEPFIHKQLRHLDEALGKSLSNIR